jgi:hypothetical protein
MESGHFAGASYAPNPHFLFGRDAEDALPELREKFGVLGEMLEYSMPRRELPAVTQQ